MKHIDWLQYSVEGKTPGQIAKQTGANRRTVESYLYRNREELEAMQAEYRNRLIDGLLLLQLSRAAEYLDKPHRRQQAFRFP